MFFSCISKSSLDTWLAIASAFLLMNSFTALANMTPVWDILWVPSLLSTYS